MSNTEKLGLNWRGKAWGDGEPIPRVTLPDGTLAEAMASLNYAWDGSAFQKLKVDASGNLLVTAVQSSTTPVLKNGLSTTVFSVVASQAAVLDDYFIYNPNSSVAYVQIFDVATSGGVTLGTTTPKWSVGIPAQSAANVARLGLAFANGIQVAATTSATGSGANGSALDTNWGYR